MSLEKQQLKISIAKTESFESNYQRLFLIEEIRNNDITLNKASQESPSPRNRCEKCGYPIVAKDRRIQKYECFICKRINVFSTLLITSYVISALIFIASIILVVFDILTFDISLMIGCLEIIFLLFFGRFLEIAVYFKLSKEDRIIAAIYRFAESGEVQAYDIALEFLEKSSKKNIQDEFYAGIFHVLINQPLDIPYYFFSQISNHLGISSSEFNNKLINSISTLENEEYIVNVLNNAQPAGVSNYVKLMKNKKVKANFASISKILVSELTKEEIENEWLREFYINKTLYKDILNEFTNQEIITKFEEIISEYTPSKVPSIDVVEGGKQILRNPLVRYLFRIFLYIGLALILSLIYQFLNNL